MGTVCAGTNVTTLRGKAVTIARAGTATCTKGASGGLRTTGIAIGDVVTVSANRPRVEYDASGYLGLRVEAAVTNDCLQSANLCVAPWVDVAGCTEGADDGPDGAQSAVELEDTSAVAVEGASQPIVTTSATTHTFSCYLRASSIAKATLTMTGTGSSTGDCSATTTTLVLGSWSRISCTSSAAYAGTLTAVTVAVGVGTVVGDTGTIAVWGCQHEVASTGATSIVPTTTAAATRGAESASIDTTSWGSSSSVSVSGYVWAIPFASGGAAAVFETSGLAALVNESSGPIRWYTGSGLTVSIIQPTSGLHWYAYHSGAVRGLGWGANTASGANAATANKFGAQLWFGGSVSGGGPPNGIVSRYCIDKAWEWCR
jgi:hypothetical protein